MNKILLGMAGIAALMMASGANAAFKVGFDDAFNGTGWDKVVEDQLVGDTDFFGEVGVIDAAYGREGALVSTALGSSKPKEIGAPQVLHLDATMATSGGSVETVTIALTDTGFEDYGSFYLDVAVNTVNNNADFFAEAWIGYDNAEFGKDKLIGTYSLIDGVVTSTLDSVLNLDADNLFSLTIFTTFTHDNVNGTSSTNTSVNIPEPSVLALFGTGLLGLGLVRRRMKK